MRLINDTFSNIRKHPFKSLVTFASVGLGVGILIFALSLSLRFNQLMAEKIDASGQVLMVTNTELQADGTYDRVRPAQLDADAIDIVSASVDGIQAAAIISPGLFDTLAVGAEKFNVRNSVGSTEQYLEVMDLDLTAGVPMTASDVDKGNKKMWLSESAAIAMFGSVDEAIGEQVQPPAQTFGPGSRDSRAEVSIFQVAGVFTDADELRREAYGIADVLIPYTSMVPSSGNVSFILDMLSSSFAVKVVDNANIDAQIYDVLALEYGLDLDLNIWEGTMQSPNDSLQDTRDTISALSFIINLLGFILLISGAIGILSIMMVEIIGKNRDIALERALGASKPMIVQKFFMQSVVLSAISGVVGIVLAYALASPMVEVVMSVFDGIDLSDLETGLVHPLAIVVGVASALLFGGLFGVLPLSSQLKQPISEGLRDA